MSDLLSIESHLKMAIDRELKQYADDLGDKAIDQFVHDLRTKLVRISIELSSELTRIISYERDGQTLRIELRLPEAKGAEPR